MRFFWIVHIETGVKDYEIWTVFETDTDNEDFILQCANNYAFEYAEEYFNIIEENEVENEIEENIGVYKESFILSSDIMYTITSP